MRDRAAERLGSPATVSPKWGEDRAKRGAVGGQAQRLVVLFAGALWNRPCLNPAAEGEDSKPLPIHVRQGLGSSQHTLPRKCHELVLR